MGNYLQSETRSNGMEFESIFLSFTVLIAIMNNVMFAVYLMCCEGSPQTDVFLRALWQFNIGRFIKTKCKVREQNLLCLLFTFVDQWICESAEFCIQLSAGWNSTSGQQFHAIAIGFDSATSFHFHWHWGIEKVQETPPFTALSSLCISSRWVKSWNLEISAATDPEIWIEVVSLTMQLLAWVNDPCCVHRVGPHTVQKCYVENASHISYLSNSFWIFFHVKIHHFKMEFSPRIQGGCVFSPSGSY